MICPCNIVKKFVPPDGTKTPKIYIAGMAPGEEEVAHGRPFVGPAGNVLRSALADAGIDIENDVRFFNVVACRTVAEFNPNKNRDPTLEEINNCKDYIFNDIAKTNPEIIIALGKTAASAFIDITKYPKVGLMLKDDFNHNNTRLRVGYHPSYILRNGGIGTSLYNEYVEWFKQFKPSKFGLKSLTVMNSNEFINWTPPAKNLGFDIEATSLNTIEKDFSICGLGFSDLDGNGYYTYLTDEDDFNKVKDKLKDIILNTVLYVFNFSYEGTALANKLQIHPYQWNMIDTRQTAMAAGQKGSLKKIAQSSGFPDWEVEIEKITKYLKELYMMVITKDGSKEKKHLDKLRISWEYFRDSFNKIDDKKNQMSLFGTSEDAPEIKESSSDTKNNELYNMCETLENLYNDPESIITVETLRTKFLTETKNKNFRLFFDLIPINIISKYCAIDAFAAIKLHHLFWDSMEPREKKAFKYLNEHAELGAAIECNGVGWNVEHAKYLNDYYQKEMLDSLKGMLSNKLFIDALGLTTHSLTNMNSCTSMDEVLKIFNPSSTHAKTRTVFNKVMNQDFCKKVYTLWLLYNEVSLSKEDEYVELKELFVELLKESFDAEEMKKIRKDKREYIINGTIEKFKRIIKFYVDKNNVFQGESYLNMLDTFELEHLNDAAVVYLYDAFDKIGGVDIDDKTTWPEEFEVLYYFRRYKKIFKSYSTYLWGEVGMDGDARLINKEDSKMVCPPRLKTNWKEYIIDNISLNNYKAIASWGFNVCGATTNRWQSRYHVWPPGSELQDLKVSKFENGLLAHVDYSQMEVRMIAALAKETSLLEAYKVGKDVHRFVASRIFNKEESAIDSIERRYAKTLTFRLIYGGTEHGIATEMFGGDIKKARKLINDFYAGMPKISQFIKNQHKAVDKGIRYVRSILGEKIYLRAVKKDSESALLKQLKKYAVNTPVQGSASHIAGLGVNRVNKEAFERNLEIETYGFTHDAGDYDFLAKLLFTFLDILQRQMEDNLIKEFNVPVKIDIEIGVSGYQMLEFKIKEKTENRLYVETHGTLEALNKLLNCLNLAELNHDYKIINEKEEFMSTQFLFMKKKSFSEGFGKTRKIISADLNIYNYS